MNNRLKELRKTLGLSQEAFGARIGVTKVSVSRFEAGVNGISDMSVKSICREYGVNETWLRTGYGSMFIEMSRAELAANIVGNALASDDDFILSTFIALGQLTPAQWQLVKDFVEKIKSGSLQ